MKKVLVTGASGFTGRHLVRQLREKGHSVRVLVRSAAKLNGDYWDGVDCREGSVADWESVQSAVAGIDTVFHLAAVYRESGINNQVYYDVHVRGTELLCRAALEANVERVVHCSTVGIHGHIESPPANEEYRVSPGDVYQETKWEGEQVARKYYHEKGLPVSIVRPTAIYGPDDERLLKLFRLANRNPAIILGNGRIFYHMVHVEDLARGIILAAEIPEAVGHAFIIGGEDYCTLNDLVEKVAVTLGRKGKIIHLPVKPFQWAGSLCEKIFIPLGLKPPIYRRRVDFFTKSRAFTIGKAKEILGYQPQVSLENGLRETAKAYQSAGWL